jgi:hypothetical protein
MIQLLGNRKRLCDGMTRRDLLQVGGIGMWGLSLATAPQSRAAAVPSIAQFGKAKRCILLYLFGAAPQHETFDPKPDAPAEIQGEMKAIATSLPGVQFGEGLPRTATIADRLAIVRSMTHPYPLHGVAYALSGLPVYTTDLETRPHDAQHWPYIGSMADYCWTRRAGRKSDDVLQHVGLPWVLNSQVDDLGLIAGPYATFLGPRFDPVWTQFHGDGQRLAPKCRHEQPKEYKDPYAACARDSRFEFRGSGARSEELSDARFGLRRGLLRQFDAAQREMERSLAVRNLDAQKELATNILSSPSLREALDIQREEAALRERYGYTLFGQSCLAARRLIEAGSRFVTVFWDAYGTYFSGGWDTHQNHYPRLREYLLPGFDPAFSTLILDLEQRGLLDDTLVICTTEHGRTPQIDSKPAGAARHHWSRAYSTVLAGGGAARGAVIGRTDRQAGDVVDCPISPKDIQATALALLGISPDEEVYDRQKRPHRVAGDGQLRLELLG